MPAKRTMIMNWPSLDAKLRVKLLNDKAPIICDAFWAALPYKSVQGHALITGFMIFATSPVFTLARENLHLFTQLAPGDCIYGSGSQNLVVCYGKLTEPEGASLFAQVVPEDLPLLARLGRRVWENTIAPFGDLALNPGAKQIILVEYDKG